MGLSRAMDRHDEHEEFEMNMTLKACHYLYAAAHEHVCRVS